MGTSVNQRSPGTDNWRIVQDIYLDPKIQTDEAARILWRAASNPHEVNLAALLARPEIGALADFAMRSEDPAAAVSAVTRFVSETKSASLASEIAKRAVVQSTGREDARHHYAERLFAEATSYLVSRDLPGYIGSVGRFPSQADARTFLREVSERAGRAARETPLPTDSTPEAWAGFVRRVVGLIRQRQ